MNDPDSESTMTSAEEIPSVPEASCLCTFQGSMQAQIRPGIWIPGIRSLHAYEETWKVSANPVVCSQDVLQAVSKLRVRNLKGNVFTVGGVKETSEKSEIEILVFSKRRNVFVVDMKFVAGENGGTFARVRAFSTGLMPAWFPLCYVFSCLFFFLPYPDFGCSASCIGVLKTYMTVPIEIIAKGRKC